MDSITIENFRCFGSAQTARIAPLTIFTGNNGTGKSTAIAAIRALWDTSFARGMPDLQAFPHDFGPYASIIRQDRGSPAPVLSGTIQPESFGGSGTDDAPFHIRMELGRCGFGTAAVGTRISLDECFVTLPGEADASSPTAIVGIGEQAWSAYDGTAHRGTPSFVRDAPALLWILDLQGRLKSSVVEQALVTTAAPEGPSMTDDEIAATFQFLHEWIDRTQGLRASKAFILAADRYRPMHTYNPHRGSDDSTGFDAPAYLASWFPRHRKNATSTDEWKHAAPIKEREQQHTMLECFGIGAGIFDSVRVHHLGDSPSDPYQIHVLDARDWDEDEETPYHNLADAGRGVGQAVIVATELLRTEHAPISLIEHPDAHLSPQAQRSLGELICDIVVQRGTKQRLIIESSGELLAETVNECAERSGHPLRPEDVSIIAFEKDGETRLRDAWADWSL